VRIWIDADACPKAVKDFLFRACQRLQVSATLVANRSMFVPRSPLFRIVVVGKRIDEADAYLVQQAEAGDLAITADIPLASALVDKGVAVVDPRGTVYTAANVKEALATRNLMQDLRESGIDQAGPPPLGSKDVERFANAFDRETTRLQRSRP
jgi:uncharacterized protein YaiI (UPF0178 family)